MIHLLEVIQDLGQCPLTTAELRLPFGSEEFTQMDVSLKMSLAGLKISEVQQVIKKILQTEEIYMQAQVQADAVDVIGVAPHINLLFLNSQALYFNNHLNK